MVDELSAAVFGYIREVPLELAATWAARAARSTTLEDVVRQRSLRPSAVGPPFSQSASASSTSPSTSTPLVVPEALVAPLAEAVTAAVVDELPVSDCSFVASTSGKWHRLSHRLGNYSAG